MAYAFTRAITVHKEKVGGTLANFPVCVIEVLSYLRTVSNGGDVENASGFDIIFVSDSEDEGSLLDWEIEKYDPVTGSIVAWIRLPSVTSSVDTTFYFKYGNAAISTFQGNVVGTWLSSFVGVWHMPGNELGVIPPNLDDSTSNNNDGTATGLSNQLTAPAKIGGGCSNTGGGTGIDCGAGASLAISSSFSVSMWVNYSSIGDFGTNKAVVSRTTATGPSATGWRILCLADGTMQWQYRAGGATFTFHITGQTNVISTWYFYTFVWDTALGEFRTYVNGILVDTQSPTTGTISYTGGDIFSIAGQPNADSAPLKGLVDECRVFAGIQVVGWMLTDFNNQNDPATFYTISAVSTPFTIECGSPPNGDVGVPYTHTFPQPTDGGAAPFIFFLLNLDDESFTPENVLNNITLDGGTGVWAGDPAAPGIYAFRLGCFDVTSREAFVDCSITIGPSTSDDPWIPAPPINPPFGWDFDNACARTGNRGVRHIADGTAEGGNARVASTTPVDVEAGWTLYLSFWAKGSGGADGSIGFGFMFYDEDNVFVGEEFIMTDTFPTDFTEFVGTVVVPVGAVTGIPMIQVIDHLTGTWCLDDVYAIRQGGHFILSSIKHYFDQYIAYRQT